MESSSFFISARKVSTCHFHRSFLLSLPRCHFAFICLFISFSQLRSSTAEKCVVMLDQVVRFQRFVFSFLWTSRDAVRVFCLFFFGLASGHMSHSTSIN